MDTVFAYPNVDITVCSRWAIIEIVCGFAFLPRFRLFALIIIDVLISLQRANTTNACH